MNFGPGFNEALLRLGKIAPNTLDRIKSEHRRGVLILRVKVRPVMRGSNLREHANDDPKESGDLRHLLSAYRWNHLGG